MSVDHEGDSIGGCIVISNQYRPSDHVALFYLISNGRLDAAEAAVVPHGGTVLTPGRSIAPKGRRTLILDSEGNRVALHSA